MKLCSGCLLRLGKKEQLDLISCFGKERSNLDLCKPTGSLAAVLGRGVCITRWSSPTGAGREELSESSWDRAELGRGGSSRACPWAGSLVSAGHECAVTLRSGLSPGLGLAPKIPPGAGQRTLCQPISTAQQHTQHQGTELCPGKE